ncbi:NTP pyrophosphohydrolase-like domain [Vibrio phage 1.210.O._10N.222.52.C2]|nr:NTP pyrophosphohydrolase-like domain [Vibrio phage 1.210.O._10N.222.52.C2]
MDQISVAAEWHKHAVPNPTDKNKCIALGVHFEEIAEMFESLGINSQAENMHSVASAFKSCSTASMVTASKANLLPLLDSIIDQNVTSVGISNAYGFDHLGALKEVNDSNHSKFEDGKAVFNDQGKITKGKNYRKPELDKFINQGD